MNQGVSHQDQVNYDEYKDSEEKIIQMEREICDLIE